MNLLKNKTEKFDQQNVKVLMFYNPSIYQFTHLCAPRVVHTILIFKLNLCFLLRDWVPLTFDELRQMNHPIVQGISNSSM